MRESTVVRDAMVGFYERLSAGDVAGFDEAVSKKANLIIGTAPGEWVTERPRMRFGFEVEGVRLEPGRPSGYEEGTLGWVVDEPTFFFPDGSAVRVRLTAVLRQEDGAWKLVHMHVSVAVPDDEVGELQSRWGTAPT